MSRNIAAALSIAAGVIVTVAILFGHAHCPEQPLMIVIDGAPHLRGAHQQKPNGVFWTPPLGGPQTVAGADVLREGTEQKEGAHAHTITDTRAATETQGAGVPVPQPTGRQPRLPISTLRRSEAEAASKEGVTDGHRDTTGDPDEGTRTSRGDGVRTNINAGALRDGREGRPPDRRLGRAPTSIPADAASREPGGEPWTNVTDQPWTTNSTAAARLPGVSAPRSSAATAGFASHAATESTIAPAASDCRPSADTTFTPSAAAWIAKANAWADSIDAKYDRSISIYYDRLRCNGSIPFGWYVSTHNTLTGAAFSDETPVEWMCAQHMDSPLAAMMVHTLPVMRPTFGGPYTSVLISYNDHDRRIAIGEGSEYAGCGVVADKPCQFRAAFPCVWPLWKLYDDGKGGAVAVVSGWDITPPGRIHPVGGGQ